MNKIFYFLMVSVAFTGLQVRTVEALPSTGVAEGEIVDFNSELACTDEDTRPRCVTAGGSAKETLRSQAGKDISAGGQQAIINPASTASKSCAAGEDCEIVDFNAELPCTDEDIATARGGCIPMSGSAGASTGATGSSPERP